LGRIEYEAGKSLLMFPIQTKDEATTRFQSYSIEPATLRNRQNADLVRPSRLAPTDFSGDNLLSGLAENYILARCVGSEEFDAFPRRIQILGGLYPGDAAIGILFKNVEAVEHGTQLNW